MLRRNTLVLAAMLALVVTAAPVMAQDVIEVSVQNPSFSWTGKEGERANYAWSATVDNPSRRDLVVNATLQLVDAEGNVVSSDVQQITVMGESQAEIEGESFLAYSDATEATDYQITLADAEE
ncbi:MAG: hypothetical protein ACOC5E_03795 [Acidobacteriota bacterium]